MSNAMNNDIGNAMSNAVSKDMGNVVSKDMSNAISNAVSNKKKPAIYDKKTEGLRSDAFRSFQFWGRGCLENILMAAVVALGLLLFRELGNSAYTEDAGGAVIMAVSLYPYLLACAGVIVVMMAVMGYFQTYFSLLVSMNVTRRSAIKGIWLSQAGMILGILLLMAVIWKLTPGSLSETGFALLPFLTMIFFAVAALGTVMGLVTIRWGKIGMIIAILIFMIAGGFCGAFFAMSGKESFMEMIQVSREDLAGINFWPMMAGSIVLYAASGIFALAALRKAEVRR